MAIHSLSQHRHFIIHKPFGYLSQFVNHQNRRKNKKLLGAFHTFPEGTMAIGRLDEDSEGLLLLTTDGKVSMQVRSKAVEKEYYAQVDGQITLEAITQLTQGVTIGTGNKQYRAVACAASRVDPAPDFGARGKSIRDARHGPTSWLSITLTEGKFRQVRRMTAAVGFPTLRLIRIRIGNITLDQLAPGQVVEVSDFQAALE